MPNRHEKPTGSCGNCGHYMKSILKFLLSHIGLVSLVVGYTIIGAFTFERLEAEEEIKVKKNVTATRKKVTDDLWMITEDVVYFEEKIWAEKVRARLQLFERELIKAMKTDGWDGIEDPSTQQWTFAGALFYSIILITTIGYGHIAPKTTWGKIVTIFYAIPGVPLMMLCLANIGDGMAQSFRFLYWKVCCYACTKKPKRKRRSRSRVVRSRYPSSSSGQPGGIPRGRASSFRRSARASQRSADSHMSDSAFYSNFDPEYRPHEIPPVESPLDLRGSRMKGKEESGGRGGSGRSKGSTSEPPPNTRASQNSNKGGDHLEIPNAEDTHEVLYNKYALEKEGILPDVDVPSVHSLIQPGRSQIPALALEGTGDFRADPRKEKDGSKDGDRDAESDRQRDGRFREPEIMVTRAARSAPGSLRGPPRPPYPDSPTSIAPQDPRDPGFYNRHLPPTDPRSRLSRLDEEYYYDEYYDEDDVDEDDDDDDVDENMDKPVPIWLGVMLVVAYIFGGAFLFSGWEEWNFLDSVYFCFITLTTIGFGDFVPAQEKKGNPELSIALCSIYLLFGIALLAMSFNLVQEEVISNVKRVAKRLGIIKEEEEEEEED